MPSKPTFFATPADFRRWLEAHHATVAELVVGFRKRHTGEASVTWSEAVDEAICFGWIDGVRRSLGEAAYTIRFTPRKPTSNWSAINVAKVAELTKLGRMRPAGVRAFEQRTAERTGLYSHERAEAAKLTAAQERELRANRKAAAFFDAQPPGYQRLVTHWVTSAKREDTRARRLAQLIALCAARRRLPMIEKYGRRSGTARPRAGRAPARRAGAARPRADRTSTRRARAGR